MLIASKMAGLPASGRIVLVDDPMPTTLSNCDYRETPVLPTVSSLASHGLIRSPPLVPFVMKKGEAKEKVAFLCWSSGTTGEPKVSIFSSR